LRASGASGSRAAPQRPNQAAAGAQQLRRAIGLEREQATQRLGDRGCSELLVGDAEPLPILAREVDPAVAEVFADVLPVLDELQAGADRVRQA
jgi:hypothetical protein